jgi:hypothetical protein
MPTFAKPDPPDSNPPRFRIVRAGIGPPVTGIITCDKLFTVYTHFWKGRTVICRRTKDCWPCTKGLAYRWHGYVSFWLPEGSHALFECTMPAASKFDQYAELYKTLRGCEFTAHRLAFKPNGRVIIRCMPANMAALVLPPEPCILGELARSLPS